MKPGPVTEHDKGNKAMLKKLTMTSCHQIVMLLPFLKFMANL